MKSDATESIEESPQIVMKHTQADDENKSLYGEVSFAAALKSPHSSNSPRSRHMIKSIVSRVSMKISQKQSKEIIENKSE